MDVAEVIGTDICFVVPVIEADGIVESDGGVKVVAVAV